MTQTQKIGLLLIAVAAVLLLTMLDYLPGQAFILTLGAGFCIVYAIVGGRSSYGNVGFLIPGTILLGIGGFALVTEFIPLAQYEPALILASIGLAFLTVMLVHTMWFKNLDAGDRFWPVYPAAGLLLFSTLFIVSNVFDISFRFEFLNYLWIAVLVAVGLWLVIGSGRKSKTD